MIETDYDFVDRFNACDRGICNGGCHASAGGSLKLKVSSVKPAKASKKVTWSSSNKKIATVSKKGAVKAKKAGTVTITAKSKANKKAKAKCKIKVYAQTKKLQLSCQSSYTLHPGESVTVSAMVTSPSKGYEPVKWSSKNGKVATVDGKGKVTAVAVGTTEITGQSGKKKVTVLVKVEKKATTPTKPDDEKSGTWYGMKWNIDKSGTLTTSGIDNRISTSIKKRVPCMV